MNNNLYLSRTKLQIKWMHQINRNKIWKRVKMTRMNCWGGKLRENQGVVVYLKLLGYVWNISASHAYYECRMQFLFMQYSPWYNMVVLFESFRVLNSVVFEEFMKITRKKYFRRNVSGSCKKVYSKRRKAESNLREPNRSTNHNQWSQKLVNFRENTIKSDIMERETTNC